MNPFSLVAGALAGCSFHVGAGSGLRPQLQCKSPLMAFPGGHFIVKSRKNSYGGFLKRCWRLDQIVLPRLYQPGSKTHHVILSLAPS